MPREDVIRLVAAVVEVLGDRLFRVELSNGHRVLAHVSGRRRPTVADMSLVLGSRVQIELSPFDFSMGRIVSEERN